MGETTSQIENHIENKRVDLQSNLKELEGKVKSATDWRHYFRQHTGTMVAAAFGGGFLISALVKGSRTGALPSAAAVQSSTARAQGNGTHEILETFDTIKTALVGVAATKFKGMLGEVLPGFSEHVAKTEAKKAGSMNAESGPQI
jgi:hypothetical protein